jgi:hypothetical protein
MPPAAGPAPGPPTDPAVEAALEAILQKVKILEFGLYGLQQLGRCASEAPEDLGPFYRLAEEIGIDILTLRKRLLPALPDEAAP